MIKAAANVLRLTVVGAALCLAACLFDKPVAEVDLTLTKVPAGTDFIIVRAVDRSDPSIQVEEELFSGDYSPGKTLHFALGKVQGREDNTLLRVEGYRDSLLVYLSLIPPGRNSTEEPLFPDVTDGWPAISFASVSRDSTAYFLTAAIRGAPANARWLLSPNVPQPGQKTFNLSADSTGFTLGKTGLVPGTWITAELRDKDNLPLPVQLRDSLLTDELVSPSGATVKIIDATTTGGTVEIRLAMENFSIPSVDEPVPGRGWPKVLDARGLRPIPGFVVSDKDFTLITGPVWRLDGVSNIVVALHYADGSRMRPLTSDTVFAATARLDRDSLPSVKIKSHEPNGTAIHFEFTQKNFTDGMHVHVYRDQVGGTVYQRCPSSTCNVPSDIWTGATRLVAVVVNDNHTIFTPQSRDTLNAPF